MGPFLIGFTVTAFILYETAAAWMFLLGLLSWSAFVVIRIVKSPVTLDSVPVKSPVTLDLGELHPYRTAGVKAKLKYVTKLERKHTATWLGTLKEIPERLWEADDIRVFCPSLKLAIHLISICSVSHAGELVQYKNDDKRNYYVFALTGKERSELWKFGKELHIRLHQKKIRAALGYAGERRLSLEVFK